MVFSVRVIFRTSQITAAAIAHPRAISNPDTIDARLLLEMLVAPIHGRLLLTGEPVDHGLAGRLVELALNGAAAAPGQL